MIRRTTFLLVMSFALLGATPALAITFGRPDEGRHPNVGALVGTFSDGTYPYCSGVLIDSNVFLTAAHCDIGISDVEVIFAEEYGPEVETFNGIFHADPEFNHRQNDPHDVAVVLLEDGPDITPARLPDPGQFDKLKGKQKFTAVGYGGQEAVNQPGGPVITFEDSREFAVGTLNAVNPAWLRISQNQATGNGGTCYGDSGGPNFLGAGNLETDIVAAVTITGDPLCKATNVVYRLDTESARTFLSKYVELPTGSHARNEESSSNQEKGKNDRGNRQRDHR